MSTETSRSLGWIQLTDLHAGQPKEGGRMANIEQALVDDLERLIAKEGHYVDVVFFTGDIAFKGSDDEYVRATALLGRIFTTIAEYNARLRPDPGAPGGHTRHVPLLIPVPGNHDLARPSASEAATVRRALRARGPTSARLWEGEEHIRDIVNGCFGGYQRWLKHHPLPFPNSMHEGIVPGDLDVSLWRSGVSVGVLGLNSAHAHLGDEDEGELHLDLSQQLELIGDNPGRWLHQHHFTVLLTHHPPSSLSSASRRTLEHEIRPHALFDLHLHGHRHVGGHYDDPGSRGIRHAFEGRSLFGAEEDGHPRTHGYTAGRFCLEPAGEGTMRKRVEIWSRKGWWDGHGWHMGPLDDWGRWRLVVDLGTTSLVGTAPDTPARAHHGAPTGRRGHWDDGTRDWLAVDTEDYEDWLRNVTSHREWVLLSASIPTARGDAEQRQRNAPVVASAKPDAIRQTIVALARGIHAKGLGLIFGGHPSITRSLAHLALELGTTKSTTKVGAENDPWLVLFQDEHYWNRFVDDVSVIARVPGVETIRVPVSSGGPKLARMRRHMTGFPGLRAAVFLGGLGGVREEFDLVGRHSPGIQRIALGLGGGMAAELLLEHGKAAQGRVTSEGRLWHTPTSAVQAVLEAL
ncbi:MAG: hypothetical protein KDK70_00495 [Myxococcales bacterium]|nr:hypothetical protein [Myxococcales bacterium]